MKLAYAPCVVMIAAGCCRTTLKTIPEDFAFSAGQESVVVGRVVLDLPKARLGLFEKLAELERIDLIVRNEETGDEFDIVCDQEGSASDYFVALPPGRYCLLEVRKGNFGTSGNEPYFMGEEYPELSLHTSIHVEGGSGRKTTVSPGVGFVPDYPPFVRRFEAKPGEVAYLGTLRFAREGKYASLGEAFDLATIGTILGDWRVEDEYGRASGAFRERFPRIHAPFVRAPMTEGGAESPPSQTFELRWRRSD